MISLTPNMILPLIINLEGEEWTFQELDTIAPLGEDVLHGDDSSQYPIDGEYVLNELRDVGNEAYDDPVRLLELIKMKLSAKGVETA